MSIKTDIEQKFNVDELFELSMAVHTKCNHYHASLDFTEAVKISASLMQTKALNELNKSVRDGFLIVSK